MSVLKAHRSESKAEFVNTANKIYVETINFLSRLSARFSRLMANDVSHLASEVLVNAEKANSIFPSDHTRKELRKQHLLESRAALMALDVELYATDCSRIIVITRVRSITRAKSGLVWSQKHSGNVSQIMRT